MGIKSLCFLLTIICLSCFCHGDDKTIISEVVGHGDCICADCAESNIKSSQAFSGIHVTIDCKASNGEIKTRGEGNLNDEGKFVVTLPQGILENGKLKEECFAKLHSASHSPCPSHNGLDSSKLIFKTKSNGKHIFTTSQKLKFSSTTCSSKTFLPHFAYPPLPKWKKHFPFYKKPCPPLSPIFKKPLPPPVPIYKPTPKPNPPVYKPTPKPPVYKPTPKPPVYKPTPKPPVYKPTPKPPVYKPTPKPPVYKPTPKPPVYKPPPYVKPLPPPVPVYKPKPKPKPPVYKPKPPVYEPKPKPPVFKPPPFVKPLPPPIPFYPFPKIHKKPPCPPFPKLPKYPKIPPKYFHHPIFAPWPPHSP